MNLYKKIAVGVVFAFVALVALVAVAVRSNDKSNPTGVSDADLEEAFKRPAQVLGAGVDADSLTESAKRGNLDAQRYLEALLAAEGSHEGSPFPYNPVLACAWSLVILDSGNERVEQEDSYIGASICNKLDATSKLVAVRQATELAAVIRRHR